MLKILINVKAFIFDLDDTLYDCSGTLVLRGREKVAIKIANLINCSEEDAYLLQFKIEEECSAKVNIYEKIVQLYNLPNKYAEELLEEFVNVKIDGITLFPDVIDTLKKLRTYGYKLILVTSGVNQIQRKKIELLGLNNDYFDYTLITDRKNAVAKRDCFKDILQKLGLKPEEIACVGDKIDDELTAAKTLGMITVLFEHGRHYKSYLQEKDKYSKPDFSIRHIKELLQYLL